jgi:carboxylesterase type B
MWILIFRKNDLPQFQYSFTRLLQPRRLQFDTPYTLYVHCFSQAKIGKSIHGEELPYVFGVPLDNMNFPSHRRFSVEEKRFSEAVMTFWTNFAKTG